MPTRLHYIKLILRQVYGGQPNDDANITPNLVNLWMNQGIALAAKQNYKDNIAIDGYGYVNSSFYVTYSRLAVTYPTDAIDNLSYIITLPHIPFALGANEGVAQLRFVAPDGTVTQTAVPLTTYQAAYADRMRVIPNKILYWSEGNILRIKTSLPLPSFTGIVKMVSGGDDTNLNNTLNIPDDYLPVVVDYVQKQLLLQRNQPVDSVSDGEDFIKAV